MIGIFHQYLKAVCSFGLAEFKVTVFFQRVKILKMPTTTIGFKKAETAFLRGMSITHPKKEMLNFDPEKVGWVLFLPRRMDEIESPSHGSDSS